MGASIAGLMASFGVSPEAFQGGELATVTPVDGAGTLLGPLIDRAAFDAMQAALAQGVSFDF